MIVYYSRMRVKDELKQEALFKATIKVVNEIGFASSSVAKIAGEAGISPATIYIYYQNKEDLLVSTYVDIKKNLSQALLKNYDESRPIRDIFLRIWKNGFAYVSKYREHFNFTEQFANSPYSELVNKAELEKYYEPIVAVFQRGIKEKILKDVEFELLQTFVFHPVMILSNNRLCNRFELTEENIEKAFTLAWDAIKL